MMKRTVVLLAALVVMTGAAQAANLMTAGPPSQERLNLAPCVLGTGSITQSVDCAIESGTGISCNGAFTTDTSFLRRFFLTADHGVLTPYTVTDIDFGVEIDDSGATGACMGNPITVNTYSIPIGAGFIYANMVLLDSMVVNLDGTTAGTVVNAAVGGTVDPATHDLVVEYVSCDHNDAGDGGRFFPGANSLGEIQPSYIAAADCGITEPIALDDIGFPNNDNVLVVNGGEDNQCVVNLAQPRTLRRSGVIKVKYDLAVQHNKADTTRPISLELRDQAGNVLATHSLGLVFMETGKTVSFSGKFDAPDSIAAGWYILAAKIEGMNGFREVKRLVRID